MRAGGGEDAKPNEQGGPQCPYFPICDVLTEAAQSIQKKIGSEQFLTILEKEGFRAETRAGHDRYRKSVGPFVAYEKVYRTYRHFFVGVGSQKLIIWINPNDSTVVRAFLQAVYL